MVNASAANDFVVVNKGRILDTGVVRVFQAAVAMPDIAYKNVEIVSPSVATGADGQPQLLDMGPDLYEPNESIANAAFLGSGATLQIQNASIFPNATANPPVPPDQDYYRVVAQQTGTLDFQVYFKKFSTALLPGGGGARYPGARLGRQCAGGCQQYGGLWLRVAGHGGRSACAFRRSPGKAITCGCSRPTTPTAVR